MNNFNTEKKILYALGSILIVILSVFLIVSTNKNLETSATTNTVSFSGEGKVLAKPDIAVVSFSVVTQGATSKEAQDKNSSKSQAVSGFLKKQNIKDADIKTTNYNIYPQYKYPRSGQPEIYGYQVSQTMEVKIRDLNKTSGLLDGVVGAGANQVSGLQFQIDNPDKLKAQARQKAIDDAKSKARELRNQLGIGLGKIVNFSEGLIGYPRPIFEAQAMDKGSGGGGPSIQPGENEIIVDVTLTYQIK